MSLYNYYLPSVDGLNNLTIGATGYTGISGSATNTGATGSTGKRVILVQRGRKD